jgi:hypothetical protein
MKEPVRLINRSGLASNLLRAGSEERPRTAQIRRAMSVLGTASAVGALTGEAAGGGASAVASGAAGATIAKSGGASVSMLLAAKWAGIGGVSAVLLVGGAELSSRTFSVVPNPATHVVVESRAPIASQRAGLLDRVDRIDTAAPIDVAAEIEAAEKSDDGTKPGSPDVFERIEPSAGNRARAREGNGEGNFRAVPTSRRSEGSGRKAQEPAPEAVPSSPTSFTDETAPGSELGAAASAEHVASSKNEAPRAGTLRLTKEVSLVDGAWSAVKRGDFARARLALSDYERQFPELGLHPEVLFVRMMAEERGGQRAAARTEASRIIALYPHSAQADGARALLSRH